MWRPRSRPNGRFNRPDPLTKPGQDHDLMSDFELCMLLFKDITDQNSNDAPDPKDLASLSVKSVDTNIRQNTVNHFTDEYDITDEEQGNTTEEFLVVRRGQPFLIAIHFNRAYDPKHDDLRFVWQYGSKPIASRRSHVEFVLSEKDDRGEWGGMIKSNTGDSVVVSVMTPPDVYVGRWKLRIDVIKKKDDQLKAYRYKHPDPIYILFNPWCKEDSVYLGDEALRNEYVLNETGKLYYGAGNSIGDRDWAFAQFDDVILDTILDLLDRNMNKETQRGNPVNVARALSKVINSSDDNGVLSGNWSGDYTGGASPTSWSGSGTILTQYHKTKSPVKFGQCWVFSGVLTTACRTLGIPCRSVTNFGSAHDTDGSITIDHHLGPDYEPLERLNQDSIWNFHVWNDVWMLRPDLPEGYGGWQAIDSTPQETSDGIYQCGPASLTALKEGRVNYGYDAPFIFGEVNADRVYWVVGEDGKMEVVHANTTSVGRNISTKKPGSNDREDVTSQYKSTESSEEERKSRQRANLYSSKPRDFQNIDGDVNFLIAYDETTMVGDDLVVDLKIKNNSGSVRNISGTFSLASTVYTGVLHEDLLKEKLKDHQLQPHSDEKLTLRLPQEKYRINATDNFQFRAIASFKIYDGEKNPSFVDFLPIMPLKPHLTIKATKTAKVGKSFTVEASFVNKLNTDLDECYYTAEGPGLQWPKYQRLPNVPANGTFHTSFDMIPRKPGKKREVVVIFNSRQLAGISGTHVVEVSK